MAQQPQHRRGVLCVELGVLCVELGVPLVGAALQRVLLLELELGGACSRASASGAIGKAAGVGLGPQVARGQRAGREGVVLSMVMVAIQPVSSG